MAHKRRGWWIGLGIVAMAVLVELARRQSPVAVEVADVTVGSVREVVAEAGTAQVRRRAEVSAAASGRWVPAGLRAGDPVRVGQALGTLYPAPMDAATRDQAQARVGMAAAALREAEARVVAALAARDEAGGALRRLERVGEAGGASPQAVEQARTLLAARTSDYAAAQLRVEAARYDLRSARSAAASYGNGRGALRVRAPVAGRVLRVHQEDERVVPAGTLLLEVGDPASLEVVVPLLTADAARISVGAPTSLQVGAGDGSGATVTGRVARIEPSAFTKLSALGVEEQRVNVVIAVTGSTAALGDRYRVEAAITVREVPQATRVPAGALVRDRDGWAVFVLRDGQLVRREVTLGARGQALVQVTAGVAAGEQVVLYPGEAVADGLPARAAK